MQAALERVLAELTLGPELELGDPKAVADFLGRCGAAGVDAEALTDGGLARLMIYRRLVRANLWSALEQAIPRTMARLGPVFEEYFARFLAERAPRTRYLRDVTRELLEWCAPAWREDARVPAWALDLARHESVQIEIGAMPAAPPAPAREELALERRAVFIEASRVVRYDHAVHELLDDDEDRTVPARRPTALFVYRSAAHEVRYLELTPLAAELLERLRERRLPLGEALGEACQAAGHPLDDAVLEGTARVLADLAERGALRGSEP
ncbi:MAG: putative DNA-binding domain-containing protein [Sorangiineae bacterium]|nr:putative DNA-binding domain-containing protein [Polyangiaceae bacterium]MEB2324436.1 putative DNA-binding domain-containing protein [Sorangiineae bacterium]